MSTNARAKLLFRRVQGRLSLIVASMSVNAHRRQAKPCKPSTIIAIIAAVVVLTPALCDVWPIISDREATLPRKSLSAACAIILLVPVFSACGSDKDVDPYLDCLDWYAQTEDCCRTPEPASGGVEFCDQFAHGEEDPEWWRESAACSNFTGFCASWGFCPDDRNPDRTESSTQSYASCMDDKNLDP